jgi:hypothetical protein
MGASGSTISLALVPFQFFSDDRPYKICPLSKKKAFLAFLFSFFLVMIYDFFG